MATVTLDPNEIVSGPEQARRTFYGIKDLANTIAQKGLLQKPLVRRIAGAWVIVAGERRIRAVRLLVKDGRWTGPIECEVDEGIDESDTIWKGLIENCQREDVPIWQIGEKFRELEERGFKQATIGSQIGKSNGYISRASRIARGLHPDIIKELDQRLPEQIGQNYLQRMSECIDRDNLVPDFARQKKMLDDYFADRGSWRKSKKLIVSQKSVVYKRYGLVKGMTMKIPDHAKPYLNAVMDYLSGSTRKIHWPEEL